jgi:type III pantothenate kinase
MNILIGDIGNTITKLCLVQSSNFKIKKIIYLNSKDISSSRHIAKLLKVSFKNISIDKISLFSSVVPKHYLKLKKLFKNIYNINLYELKEKKINKIIKVKVKNTKQVGSDRIANAAGVYKYYKANCIVVDFGTATTFDVIMKNGFYMGGVIAPGVSLSIKSLSASADQIPLFNIQKQNKIIGKNTIEALHSGFYWGYSGLINNIIYKIQKETHKKYKIVFTGGYADLFKSSIIRPFIVDKNITIKGIIEIYKQNRKNLI